jgi:hypothetical protein
MLADPLVPNGSGLESSAASSCHGRFTDRETGSTWTITGEAVDGPLKGERLQPIEHGDYFSFAWFAFRPQTTIYSGSAE